MKTDNYILDPTGEKPIPCDDLIHWSKWMQRGTNRVVAQEYINNGTILVSTVFLGHATPWNPRLWETMAFRIANESGIDWLEFRAERCNGTREQALAQHKFVIDELSNETTTQP